MFCDAGSGWTLALLNTKHKFGSVDHTTHLFDVKTAAQKTQTAVCKFRGDVVL
jgi:hypothetical protein